jgi:hypothetical protein
LYPSVHRDAITETTLLIHFTSYQKKKLLMEDRPRLRKIMAVTEVLLVQERERVSRLVSENIFYSAM